MAGSLSQITRDRRSVLAWLGLVLAVVSVYDVTTNRR